ncbi:hypothetical protein GCM10007415_24860 [Parapedobacter pyrenivorans]|uniref:Uncharacterized protein n=1 Tax=Parapedobacter pyrenivorans TaxID=1305674 RepID=A0A917HUQ6_9SPHI|nr:DUF6266 family protein [Parapedobacter pyrenivorans]GGG89669.1 hypothetical protein GCM10007415_24860 [Parapedobacter pyrenivorans]
MGVIRRGANGGFKGKAGSVIGSSWKSIDYIKGLYKKRTKPATEEQLMQQAKFTLLMRFLLPLKVFIRVGYGQRKTDTHTPMNVAFQSNLSRAITGDYPDYMLDYSQVRIAEGYSGGGGESASAAAGVLTVTWNTVENGIYAQQPDDRMYIVLYHPGIDQFLTAPTPPQRADGTVEIVLPNHFQTDEGHVWLFTADRKGRNVSRSVYLGEVALV